MWYNANEVIQVAYQITEEEYQAVIKAERKTRDKRISKRLQVVKLRYEGMGNSEIAKKLDFSSGRVSHLISEFKKQGLEEYMRVKYEGNHRNMSYVEEQAILDSFEKQAEAGQIITVKEIKAAFDHKLGHDTGRGYIYMLLARHGWRKLKPRSKHPKKASEEEIDASKKLNPSWKKSS